MFTFKIFFCEVLVVAGKTVGKTIMSRVEEK